jgi:AraC-like DNA-binding protein
MQLGARLLRESSRIVADIALEVGYESEAAFARAFERMVGMPPAAWRRAQAGSARSEAAEASRGAKPGKLLMARPTAPRTRAPYNR